MRSRHRKTGGTVHLHARLRSMTTTDELKAVDAVTNMRLATIGDGGRLVAGSTVLAEKVFAELHQQRAWWTRAHLTVEVARWISEPSPLAVEVEVERLAAMCLPLEPDSDVDYAQPDIAKLTSPTIMRAERRVIASLDEPAPFTVDTVRDPRLGDDQIRAVRAITEGSRRVTTIIEPAGAGKTTMLQAAGRSVEYAARDVTVLCLSATAARVVTEETGMAAHTIASWRIGHVELPHGEFMLPPTATVSVEADLLPFDDLGEVKADTIDGLLGADSYFAAKYGIYADGVSAWTAHLPDSWEQRLVRRLILRVAVVLFARRIPFEHCQHSPPEPHGRNLTSSCAEVRRGTQRFARSRASRPPHRR